MGSSGGSIGSTVGGIFGGYIGAGQAAGDKSKAQGYAEDAFNELLGIGMPPDLSKELILQHFQQAGLLNPEMEQAIEQTYSAVQQMQEDPTGRNTQLEALAKLKNLSKSGLGAEDRAALNQVRDQVQRDLEGKRQQILQSYQARGMGGSGAELIAQLQGSQAGANQASMEGDRLAAMAQQRAREALMQSANLGGQLRTQDYIAAMNRARAEDELNRFNVQNQIARQQRNIGSKNAAQQFNLQNKQRIMDSNVAQANQELYRQNEAKRDYWQDQIDRANLRSGAYKGLAGEYGRRAQNIAKGKQDEWTAWGGLVDKGIKAAATYGASEVVGAAHGGMIPGEAPKDGDTPENDIVDAKLSPGEIVIPRSIAMHEKAPEASKKFVDLILTLEGKRKK